MKVETFELERVQSVWENQVEYNLTESGLHPFALKDLLTEDQLEQIISEPLGYGQTNGSIPLREAITQQYQGADADNVLVTNGSAESNFIANWSTLDAGDEIVYMLPNYMQIWGLANALSAEVKPLYLREELAWQPDLDELRQLISPQTKVIGICNPNNPTGSVLSPEGMEEIVRLAREADAWLFVDEVYRGAELDGVETSSLWGQYEKAVITCGLSKAYGLPGLRIGWLIGPKEFIETAWAYTDYTTITTGVLGQQAATYMLEPSMRAQIFDRNRTMLKENLAILRSWIDQKSGLLELTDPQGGGMAFIRYHLNINSTEMTTLLREQKSVLIVPGDCFGMDGFVRIGIGSEKEYLTTALDRVGDFLAELAS